MDLRLVNRRNMRYTQRVEGERPGLAKVGRLAPVLDEAVARTAGPALVRGMLEDLEALLDRSSRLHARLRGDSETGEAWLIRFVGAHEAQILKLAWNESQISQFEVKSRKDTSELDRLPVAEPAEVVERVVPMLWSHLRMGGSLPPGVRRFAPFFSLR